MQKNQSKVDLPDKRTQDILNGLTRSRLDFALYRLPWADRFHLVMQTSGEVEQLADIRDLNGKKGFVMAPFRLSAEHPSVLIRPDVTADGWDEIGEVLSSSEFDDAVQMLHNIQSTDAIPVCEDTEKQQYAEAFGRFIEPLRSGRFQKLVLSRSATRRLDDGFAPLTAFVQACNRYPRMMTYLCHTPASGMWIGSTPEILLSGQGTRWNTVALAGTMPMQGEVMPTDWSRKNREEQAYVAGYIRRILLKYAEALTECAPYTARAGQVVHLKTDFGFRLPSTHCLGDLLHELHPTPAVCGYPKRMPSASSPSMRATSAATTRASWAYSTPAAKPISTSTCAAWRWTPARQRSMPGRALQRSTPAAAYWLRPTPPRSGTRPPRR